MPIDPSALVAKVIERAAERCGQAAPMIGVPETQIEDVLVEALASRLLAWFGLGSGDTTSTPEAHPDDALFYRQLVRRNRSVAEAVGACECWGELGDCAICSGRGGPGWKLPNRQGFEVVIRPALKAVREHQIQARGRQAFGH